MNQPAESGQDIDPSPPSRLAMTFGLREAIIMAFGGIAVAVAAALYLS